MKYFFLVILFISVSSKVSASFKNDIIQNLKNTQNLSFNFEQNINGKLENGNCIIEYPKKIFCKYNLSNKKILVSNGKSLVIKTKCLIGDSLTPRYLMRLKLKGMSCS